MEIDVMKIARLSRIKVTEDELAHFQKEMQNMINMVEKLPDIPVASLAPDKDHPMGLRKDEIQQSLRRDEVLQNAPETEAGCFVVPNVMD